MMASSQPTVPLKRLTIKFVKSGDEVSQIVHADELATKKRKKSIQTFRTEEKQEDGAVDEEDETEKSDEEKPNEEEEVITSSSIALLGDDEMDGGQVYSFRTPKRSNRAAQMAARSIQKTKKHEDAEIVTKTLVKSKTPKRVKDKTESNTESASAARNSSAIKSSKKRNDQNGHVEVQETSTRRRSSRIATVRRHYQRQDSSDESVESSSEEDDDAESVTSEASELSGPVRRGRRSKVPQATNKESGDQSEHYFLAHAGGVVTSDHTLSRLANPKMNQKELDSILKTAVNSNNEEKRHLFEEHTELFHKWMVMLSNGFNLLLYGLGSKRHLMETFRSKHLSNFYHIVINGFFPSLAIRQILAAISEDILESQKSARSLQEQLELVKSELENKNEPVFIIIHNIDGPTLRVTKNQNVLSSLAQIHCVHVIASLDHINAPLIWDQGRFCSFNWLWYDVTSYEDYTEETSYENSLLVRQSGALTLSSINHVLKSVPPNVQGVFNILVDAQLEHKDDISYSGMTFQDLYQRCREAFYVSSDLTLRAQLTEFKDHKLLVVKKGIDGAELLSIPIESSTLQEFKHQEDL